MSNDNDLTNDRKIKISFNGHRKYLRMIIYVILLIASVIIVSNQGGTFSYVFFYGVLLYFLITSAYIFLHALYGQLPQAFTGAGRKNVQKRNRQRVYADA